jgi:protein tyrosine/serine phosphatase
VLTVALACCAAASASWHSKHPHPQDCNPGAITQKEVPNFHYVDNDLYRGGHPDCAGLLKLEDLGIRTVVDLGGGVAGTFHHCKDAQAAGIQVIRYKISLPEITLLGVPDKKLRNLFALIQNAPKPIFLSCSLGRDRTGLIVALYRLKRGEMSFPEAESEAIYYGYRPHFWGLHRAFERYKIPRELERLPAPAPVEAPAASVCRPKSLMSSSQGF